MSNFSVTVAGLHLTMAQSTLDTMPGASTGTVEVTEPLNFWAGKRLKPRQEKNAEPVFEPATGKYSTIKSGFSHLMLLLIRRRLNEDIWEKYRFVG